MINAALYYVPRTACLIIGYFFGCLLTGAWVVRLKTGKSASEFGSGNPGMANVTIVFGLKYGLIVLAGDLLKTILACLLCLYLFGGEHLSDPYLALGQISCLWAGLGAVLGHNWPFWRGFSGGKGVAVTCMAIFLFSPSWGLLADLAGMLTVFATGFLPLGAVVITVAFALLCRLFLSTEAFLLALFLMILMFSRHWKGLIGMVRGQEERYCQLLKTKKKAPGAESLTKGSVPEEPDPEESAAEGSAGRG